MHVFDGDVISVPIRGLFNLTVRHYHQYTVGAMGNEFPSPLGDYLI